MADLNFEELCLQYHDVIKEALLKKDVNIIKAKYKSLSTAYRDVKSSLDQAFRDVNLQLINEADVEKLQECVTLSIDSCRISIIGLTMPVVLLGDIFECSTLNKCEQMFTFVENGVNIWKEELFFSPCRNNLLRLCNDLLRRLSRTQHTVFCGRILLFLAKFFPFSERSGLNIVSEFNLENITEYKKESLTKENVEKWDIVKIEKKISIDFNLYCKFWALQDFFRYPTQCYSKANWHTFVSYTTNVVSAFSSCKLEDVQGSKIKIETDVLQNQDEQYFAKFLTNQKLLELQLSDSNFRRCILIQFLILFQYLNSSVKFKTDSHELKPDQIEWVKTMKDKVYALIEETPPDGKKFSEIVQHMLTREELWNTWKNDGCPEFKKPIPIPETSERKFDERKILKPKRRLFGDIMKEADSNHRFCMGSFELTKLWNLCPDNLESCKGKERDFLPQLDSYFSEAFDQLDLSQTVEGKVVNDDNFSWRALRLLARRSSYFFAHSNNPIPKLSDYLEMLLRKIERDRRDTVPDWGSRQMRTEIEEEVLNSDVTIKQEITSPAKSIKNENITTVPITQSQLREICEQVGENWKILAQKLGFKLDDINFFETENSTIEQRARNVLQLWFLDDEDANLENLCYILEGLGMTNVSDTIKKQFIENAYS